ncbi:hypothetical protein LSH36_838g01146, partial [Paralvinella palmiformis]
MRVLTGAVCLCFMCCISSAQMSWTESAWQTLGSWLPSTDPDIMVDTPGPKETVEVLWGQPDTEANVGEVFE